MQDAVNSAHVSLAVFIAWMLLPHWHVLRKAWMPAVVVQEAPQTLYVSLATGALVKDLAQTVHREHHAVTASLQTNMHCQGHGKASQHAWIRGAATSDPVFLLCSRQESQRVQAATLPCSACGAASADSRGAEPSKIKQTVGVAVPENSQHIAIGSSYLFVFRRDAS